MVAYAYNPQWEKMRQEDRKIRLIKTTQILSQNKTQSGKGGCGDHPLLLFIVTINKLNNEGSWTI